jgi:pepF/M3 family oligoendopeptidase
MSADTTLPHWQLTSIFPGLESAEFESAKTKVKADLEGLEQFMEAHHVRAEKPQADAETLDELLGRFNTLITRFATLNAYLHGFIATDAFNDRAQAEMSALRPLGAKLGFLEKRFTAWLGGVDLEPLLQTSSAAKAHEYFLRRAQEEAEHLLGDEAEELLSALTPSGGSAWAKLHSDLVSREAIRLTLPGREEADYPLAELSNLQADADPAVRQAAYEAELELLERNAVAYAAAMNSIKAQVGEVAKRRGWESPLAATLFDCKISAKSLEAMQQACQESFPVMRRYLKAKAKLLGKEKLAWYDRNAPVTQGESRRYGWAEARDFVLERFRSYTDKLAAFAARAFDEHWLDAPPHKGKTNGAFCIPVWGVKESRVMLNFGGQLDDLFTIAHELGHGYHNSCMFAAERTPLQADTPMNLAETASTFCETLVVNALLKQAEGAEKLAILEQDLRGAAALILDIHSRFLFEKAVFERRAERELSIGELKSIMLDAQDQTYGEALEEDARHPNMWSHKSHYYSVERSFYNFPYTFGYLFGLGLYAQYQKHPEGFAERYDELLNSTGKEDAAPLAKRFGIDIESPDFWRSSLAVAEGRVKEYETLVSTLV